MERERPRTGEPVRRAEERGRWRDAAERGTERARAEEAAERAEVAGDRGERERMERDRQERERLERERRELRERSERGDLLGRGMGGSSLAARDPWIASHFDFMRQFMREMSRMFEGWPGPTRSMGGSSGYQGVSPYSGSTPYPGSSPYQGSSVSGWPPIEVEERDGQMLVRAELPGMNLQDVRVCLEGNYLLIEGERREDRKREREGYYETEWSYGHFSRRIPMPPGVTPDQIHATCENGVLELTIDVPTRNVREIPIATERSDREGRTTGRASGRDRDVPPARTEG